nr:MAG TPA: hypothetical protein [Caudoviricetes sp.]DAN83464.1 MAG TPA: hypothetical protein [Caudoviricetes sp.]DAZ55860.1 MAG TPA: hypothetical protein [Caudoviricetes sp.]
MYIKTAVASVLKAVIWPSKESKNNLYLRGVVDGKCWRTHRNHLTEASKRV